MTGAQSVVEVLTRAGVRHLFALSGNQNLPIFDACIGSGIRLIHTRHEAAAVHMADGWGRLCG
ncbi:MAG: thiamine pyrophosphate-binding protein, partial [Gemmatimonadetes bacterium]|nr:thiamine pyrophosphate-binding protein [Gemmatimonadota bacterium]